MKAILIILVWNSFRSASSIETQLMPDMDICNKVAIQVQRMMSDIPAIGANGQAKCVSLEPEK